jgi:magnesium-transporting ATPase (P-type)
MGELYTTVTGWVMWVGIAATVISIAFIGIRVIYGMRGRSQIAADALGHAPYVALGSALITSAVAITRVLYGG